MTKIEIKTSKEIVPKIYAYSTPEVPKHNGWTKIGYTEREDVMTRINEQTHTVGLIPKLEWYGVAVYDGEDKVPFKDTDFHVYLRKQGYENEEDQRNEWFKIDGIKSKEEFDNFKGNQGILPFGEEVIPYCLREEQEKAVKQTKDYFENTKNGEYLWNAKPRFGKTLSVYDFFKQIKAKNVLIVTNRPAIANSWYEDYVKFMGDESGLKFVSDTSALKGKKYVIPVKKFSSINELSNYGCIEFVSLQDLKGSIYFGGDKDKLNEITELEWDVLVVDEAHEGVDTYKTDIAFDNIKRKFTLHLSGTPFKALANEKFNENAIFNWTYADEQRAKLNWDSSKEGENPYAYLPKLNLYTYQMSEIVKDVVEQGVQIGEEIKEYAFDLNEFFMTDGKGKFKHESAVDKFLDSLTKLEKMPFSTDELRSELKHTFWLLNRVDSVKALYGKLKKHSVFKDYEIVLAAGDGKVSDDDDDIDNSIIESSYNKVKTAIKNYDKTITLSVKQLTTGVTIPEWSGVLMLSNLNSSSLYMQAAFRAQNPCLYKDNKGNFYRKENAYVFDFDPARTLIIYEDFATNLNLSSVNGRGSSEDRKQRVYELLNFFPVIGEDDNGSMVELDAEKVLSIPRKIKSKEVVSHGFMSNFLFINICNIFKGPSEVFRMINEFEAISQPKKSQCIDSEKVKEVGNKLDENGGVCLSDDYIIGKSTEIFGDKVYMKTEIIGDDCFSDIITCDDFGKAEKVDYVKEIISDSVMTSVKEKCREYYGDDLSSKDISSIIKSVNEVKDQRIERVFDTYEMNKKILDVDEKKALKECSSKDEQNIVMQTFSDKKKELEASFSNEVETITASIIDSTPKKVIELCEEKKAERNLQELETIVRDHLRGFSRTIPSFLMAYGKENTTLSNFDTIAPDNVFKEVTGITLDQFRFLRDGGDYPEDGVLKHFEGNLFDEIVFNDSVKEFMALKSKLSNYFDVDSSSDIFDYIPPQKTNQIFTPKSVVIEMVNLLEKNNPGCFSDDTKTFVDLYMKSGLYITEIVKRLYRNVDMKTKYPDGISRLKHIFKHQVYGFAPSEIIYNIAKNFIIGFDKDGDIEEYNLYLLDTKPLVESNTLEEKINELLGESIDE